MTSQRTTKYYSCVPIKDQNASPSICCFINAGAEICVTQFSAYCIICVCSLSFCRGFNCYFAFKWILFNIHVIVLPSDWPSNIPKISCFIELSSLPILPEREYISNNSFCNQENTFSGNTNNMYYLLVWSILFLDIYFSVCVILVLLTTLQIKCSCD